MAAVPPSLFLSQSLLSLFFIYSLLLLFCSSGRRRPFTSPYLLLSRHRAALRTEVERDPQGAFIAPLIHRTVTSSVHPLSTS